ncbi:hypothetical protein KSP39_PZI021176 [Platanthera zijinensis]|uniref:VQ domain-containing protein n=1 Tax=Platanthera zijinensis TaxID=2320716 RepID=A0AAP0AXD9_9ASPA
MPSSSGRGIQGPRPHALKVSREALKAGKSPVSVIGGGRDSSGSGQQCPMIVYLHSPKVIHARPQDFMSVVQKLTGKDAGETRRSPSAGGADGGNEVEEDPLLLTLGQSPSASAWVARSSSPAAAMASPAGLFSPSPNLKACLQEFGSLF